MEKQEVKNLKHRIRGCAYSMYSFNCIQATCGDLISLLNYIDKLEEEVDRLYRYGFFKVRELIEKGE